MVIFKIGTCRYWSISLFFGLWLVSSGYNTISLKSLFGLVFTMFKMSLLRSTPYINVSLLLDVQEFSLKPQVLSLHSLGYGSNGSFSFAFCCWPGSVEMKALHCQKHKNMQGWAPFTHSTLSPKWAGRVEPCIKRAPGERQQVPVEPLRPHRTQSPHRDLRHHS